MPIPVDVIDNWVDYLALTFSFLAALGTVVAVGVSVQTARNAQAHSEEADKAAQKANARSVAAQLEASEMVARTEVELEAERQRVARRLATEQKASRQAADVLLFAYWVPLNEGGGVAEDLHAEIGVRVWNTTTQPITDVEMTWHGPSLAGDEGPVNEPIGGSRRIEGGSRPNLEARKFVAAASFGDPLPVTCRFTDKYLDRWELSADRSLLLLTPRIIDIKEQL